MAVAISRIRDLIIKHLKEELTEEESQELRSWVHQSEENTVLFNQFTDPDNLEELIKESDVRTIILKKIEARLADDPQYASSRNTDLVHLSSTYQVQAHHSPAGTHEAKIVYLTQPARRSRTWIYAAAACLLLFFAGSYFWFTSLSHAGLAANTASPSKNDVAPGGDKALLTLANGSTIVLENAANGNLTVQGISRVSKDKNLLAYTVATSTASVPALIYNTLTTPRAGQFQLILPDGSRVWLNNASSLRYPTAFSGRSREVTLSGEAYFEIAKDVAKPFIVRVNELAINVLGTSFNVMAYGDEPAVRTTLLNGKVSLAEGSKQSVLAPGEQAVIGKEGNWRIAKGVDVDEAIAWQRGYFHFNHEDIGGVLRQLGRWYDVEPVFTIATPDYTFDGEIDRSLSLSSILRHLEKADLHFQIDGKKLIVSK